MGQLQQQQQAQPQQQQQQQAQPHHQQPGAAAVPPGGIQIVQQLITPTGEIHQILPVQLNRSSFKCSEPRWSEVQALRSPSSSKPPRFKLNLHNLPRLSKRYNFYEASTCTTSSNSTDFTLPHHPLMC